MNDDDNMTGDALAARTFTPTGGQAQADSQAQADQAAQQAEAANQFAQSVEKTVRLVTRVARAIAAAKVPEIREEVTDQMLDDWATASVPLLGGFIGRMLAKVSVSEEGQALIVATGPIVVACFVAVQRHQATIDVQATEVTTTAEPEPAA